MIINKILIFNRMKKLIGLRGVSLKVTGFLFIAMTALSACSRDEDEAPAAGNNNNNGGGSGPGTNEVWMQGSSFTPATITVTVGTKVTWTNKDGVPHTVTSSSGLFNSGNMNNAATYSYTFTAAGTYPYYCGLHANMTGSVIVN